MTPNDALLPEDEKQNKRSPYPRLTDDELEDLTHRGELGPQLVLCLDLRDAREEISFLRARVVTLESRAPSDAGLHNQGENSHGVDVGYFARELDALSKSLPNRTKKELNRYLIRLAEIVGPSDAGLLREAAETAIQEAAQAGYHLGLDAGTGRIDFIQGPEELLMAIEFYKKCFRAPLTTPTPTPDKAE